MHVVEHMLLCILAILLLVIIVFNSEIGVIQELKSNPAAYANLTNLGLIVNKQ